MGTDLSAMVIGFADRAEVIKAVNRAFFALTGLAVDSSQPVNKLAEVNNAVQNRDKAIFSLRAGRDYLEPHIVIHCLMRWKPEDASTYEAFVAELREVFPAEEIVLMSDYDVEALEDTTFTADELRTNPRFIQLQ